MILVVVSLGGLIGVPKVSRGEEMDREVLQKVKEATVFIRLKVDGKDIGSGSGFVFKVIRDSVLVMTNRHVAVPSFVDLPEGKKIEISAVFRSSTDEEQELPATLRAIGSGEITDLAVLEVKGLRKNPLPIKADIAVTAADKIDMAMSETELREVMPAFALGFPLGKFMPTPGKAKNNPPLTINSMSVSQLQRDNNNVLVRVMFAGAVISGNSGGPVIDTKGRLVGVIVSRLEKENVGFAIPTGVIADFLSGDVGDANLVEVLGSGPETQLKIVMNMSDPLERVNGIGVRISSQPVPAEVLDKVVPRASVKHLVGILGGYPEIAGGKTVKMKRDRDQASATVAIPINRPEDRRVYLQFSRYDFQGKVIATTKPIPVEIPNKPGKLRLKQDASNAQLAKWTCESNIGEGMAIRHLPGSTRIDLPAGIPINNGQNWKLFNAPCALVKVAGNFMTSVLVDDSFDPGGEPITHPVTGKKLNFTFQSAGLLIWQDERNFIRFERNKRVDGDGLRVNNQILVEINKRGKKPVEESYTIPDGDVTLMAERKGSSLRLYFVMPPNLVGKSIQMALDFDEEIYVGVSASNLSKKPFQAKLDNFQLVDSDLSPIEAKSEKMPNLVKPPYTRLEDGTILYEGAELRVAGRDNGSARPENMQGKKGSWTNGRQLLWQSAADKEILELEIPLPVGVKGRFEVRAKFSNGPKYGNAKFNLDSTTLFKGAAIGFYSPEVQPTETIKLGVVTIDKSMHKLRVTIDKKNTRSLGYHIGLDEIQLVPVK